MQDMHFKVYVYTHIHLFDWYRGIFGNLCQVVVLTPETTKGSDTVTPEVEGLCESVGATHAITVMFRLRHNQLL